MVRNISTPIDHPNVESKRLKFSDCKRHFVFHFNSTLHEQSVKSALWQFTGFSECEEVGMTPYGLHKALSHGCLVVVKFPTIGPHQLLVRQKDFYPSPTQRNKTVS